jgi:hypothetical protein
MNTSIATMNIITPNANPKLRITMPSKLSLNETPMTVAKKPFDEYTLFLLLEQERNSKLKEVYHKRGVPNVVHDEDQNAPNKSTELPAYPPRYYNLSSLSADWFISKLNNPRRPLPTKTSMQSWKALDQISMAFLRDLAAILRDEYNEPYQKEQTPVSTPTSLNRSMTITPVPSPSKGHIIDGFEALLLASELTFPRLPSLFGTDDSRLLPARNDFDVSDGAGYERMNK